MIRRLLALAFCACAAASLAAQHVNLAPTPPMGWNSWDAYGFTIDEAQFRENVKVLASLKPYGWQYAVIDEGWYMRDPFAATTAAQQYLFDRNGLLLPVVERFPSAANDAGFKPLADWVHGLGLRFGIHVVRGIPKSVVEENLPIAGSSFHAADAADRESPCPWNDANWGVADNAAGQAYYDSMMRRYASWDVDFIKVDCISDRPYRPTEIRQVADAIRKTGRPIVLSLSPGPTAIDHAAEVAKYAEMWRISDDHWDLWTNPRPRNGSEYPFGLREAFDRLAAWNPYVTPGHWPDPDMLPEGVLGPHPGSGKARHTNLTDDEARTEFTLWAVSRSPLIFGGNLTQLDGFSRALMTNEDLTDLDQHATSSAPLKTPLAGLDDIRVWKAVVGRAARKYCALFNLGDAPAQLHVTWAELGYAGSVKAVDVWTHRASAASPTLDLTLPAHGSALFQVE